ncbi:phosphogluconate dehydrogenase C-terminal domain-containing protein [Halopenitus salinus]|uniref:Phosphogluconate dehydrogenase C-terminal domain-containing protein n=1 Tax=Halopenitus salinus TaxID=1198295 RepID=A0ABD5UUG0_9EURY
MSTATALLGAGGKMGLRIVDRLEDHSDYEMRYVEPAPEGRERLDDRGVSAVSQETALDGADVVILAVPDTVIDDVCDDVVPELDAGTMVILLDPAAAYAGGLPAREDVSYFITHPCHPPLFNDETDPEAKRDLFGGQDLAKQNIVCALHQGPESDYDRGEEIARDIYAPVMDAHRVTTEQMAFMEPALVETVTATCLYAIREAMDYVVEEAGIPEEAARDFVLGHVRTESAVIFDEVEYPLSDAALEAVEEGREELFRDGWKERVFTAESVEDSTRELTEK